MKQNTIANAQVAIAEIKSATENNKMLPSFEQDIKSITDRADQLGAAIHGLRYSNDITYKTVYQAFQSLLISLEIHLDTLNKVATTADNFKKVITSTLELTELQYYSHEENLSKIIGLPKVLQPPMQEETKLIEQKLRLTPDQKDGDYEQGATGEQRENSPN